MKDLIKKIEITPKCRKNINKFLVPSIINSSSPAIFSWLVSNSFLIYKDWYKKDDVFKNFFESKTLDIQTNSQYLNIINIQCLYSFVLSFFAHFLYLQTLSKQNDNRNTQDLLPYFLGSNQSDNQNINNENSNNSLLNYHNLKSFSKNTRHLLKNLIFYALPASIPAVVIQSIYKSNEINYVIASNFFAASILTRIISKNQDYKDRVISNFKERISSGIVPISFAPLVQNHQSNELRQA